MQEKFIIIKLCFLVTLFSTSYSFFHSSVYTTVQNTLSRSKPLRTAGNEVCGLIPRLEPGLRLFKNQFEASRQFGETVISTFSLEWLSQYEKAPSIDIVAEPIVERRTVPVGQLFGDASEQIRRISTGFVKYMKRVMAATMVFASSLNVPSLKRVSLSAGALMTAITAGPKMMATAAIPKQYRQLSPTEKLGTTPLYYISNSRGNAYLQEDIQAGRPEQRIVVYFMSIEDAGDYLNEMSQVNAYSANEFRIMTVSMEKIVNQIQSRKQSRKLGRYEMDMIYRIQPSARQCENAEKLISGKTAVAKKGEKKKPEMTHLGGISIPMFSAQGLMIRRANGEAVTPYYFAYEDLMEDWKKMENNDKTPTKPKVVVKDFTEVMCLSQGISASSLGGKDPVERLEALTQSESPAVSVKQLKQALGTPGVVPPRREIELIRKYYRQGTGLSGEYSKAKLFSSP